MDPLLIMGIILMVVYVVGQFVFGFYSQSAYQKLRNDIITQGRLISMVPVLEVTTITTMPGAFQPQPSVPGAAPQYMETFDLKSKVQPPPPYAP